MSKFLALVVSVFYFILVHGAEYCQHYPGDSSFSYAVTNDADYWFQNYKNAYTGKKGDGIYTVYHRKTTISRRPHSIYNNMNNIPIVQQSIQQQQVQQVGPVPVDSENVTAEEPESLPIWKITIPRQVSRVVLARVENGQAMDHFQLNKTHFDNPNMTTVSSAAASGRAAVSSATSSVSTRVIDITDQSIIPDAWYLICLDVNVVQKGMPDTCIHCDLLQARTDSARQQFLEFEWATGTITNNSASLRYAATDFPFEWATIRSKVWTKYGHPRCHGKVDHVIFESKDFAYPEHFTFVTVRNLLPTQEYVVQVNVDLPWKREPKGILPLPLLIQDYLHNDMITNALAKCDDYPKESD